MELRGFAHPLYNKYAGTLWMSARFVVNAANTRKRECGSCGTGVGLAFLPPIGFRIASAVKKKEKKK
jgi:hypothetical protein